MDPFCSLFIGTMLHKNGLKNVTCEQGLKKMDDQNICTLCTPRKNRSEDQNLPNMTEAWNEVGGDATIHLSSRDT